MQVRSVARRASTAAEVRDEKRRDDTVKNRMLMDICIVSRFLNMTIREELMNSVVLGLSIILTAVHEAECVPIPSISKWRQAQGKTSSLM